MMKIWAAISLATILLVTALYLQANSQKTVIVGFDAPLSVRAAFDPSGLDAAAYYLKENPGSRLQPQSFFYDFEPTQARSLFIEAKAQEIPFFITTQPSSLASAGIDLFADDQMLLINTSSTTLKMTGLDDFILRIIPDLKIEQTAIAAHLFNQPQRRLLVLQDSQNAAYTDPAWEVFSSALSADDDWTITRERFSFVDFSVADYLEVISQPHDAIYILAGDFQAAIGVLAQLFHSYHPEAPIYLTPWATSGPIVDRIGPAIDRVTVFVHQLPDQDESALNDFYARFIERYGYRPTEMAPKILIALEVLEYALANGHTHPRAAKRFLLNEGSIPTRFGTIELNATGDNEAAEFAAMPLSQIRF